MVYHVCDTTNSAIDSAKRAAKQSSQNLEDKIGESVVLMPNGETRVYGYVDGKPQKIRRYPYWLKSFYMYLSRSVYQQI